MWPTPQDYQEAIQHPQTCFEDVELRSGTAKLDGLGLPKPISGGFASVYQMQCGQREWAVRCFLHEYSDQQQRYAAISNHLIQARLPYTVQFEYLPRGILIRGRWYPIVKMEWVQGESLSSYLERHVGDSMALQRLAQRWIAMLMTLEQTSIAHGDLQHGNILIVNEDFKLIDYDGMFVPALLGQHSHERGHRNYQHPQRSELDFGPDLDRFSSWVIYVSLLALSFESKLRSQFGASDECILFKEDDFKQPHASAAIQYLTQSSTPVVQAIAIDFQSLIYLPPQQIPSLSSHVSEAPAFPKGESPGAEWVQEHLAREQEALTAHTTTPATYSRSVANSLSDSTWVLDHLDETMVQPFRRFDGSLAMPRSLMALCSSVMVLMLALGRFSASIGTFMDITVIASLALIEVLAIGLSYVRRPERKEKHSLINERESEQVAKRAIGRQVTAVEKKKEELRRESDRQKAVLNQEQGGIRKRELAEREAIAAILRSTLTGINDRRQGLRRDETKALSKVQSDIGASLAALDKKLASLDGAEQQEVANTLKWLQAQVMEDYILRNPIESATLPGIGPSLKARLKYSGFPTASTIDYYRVQQVPGIGSQKAYTLEAWKQRVLSEANRRKPTSLPAGEMQAIRMKYHAERQLCQDQKIREQARLSSEIGLVRQRYTVEQPKLDAQQTTAQEVARQNDQAVTERYMQEYARIAKAMAALSKDLLEKCTEADQGMPDLQRAAAKHDWRLAKMGREIDTYRQITLPGYLLAILGVRAK